MFYLENVGQVLPMLILKQYFQLLTFSLRVIEIIISLRKEVLVVREHMALTVEEINHDQLFSQESYPAKTNIYKLTQIELKFME